MGKGLRFSPSVASPLLLVCVAASSFAIAFFRFSGDLVQTVAVLLSMEVIFFASHPLGHFFWAMAYGVRTEYFFLARSDFRRLASRPMALVGHLVPTIGTKLSKDELARLTPRKRGYVFGAGVMVSITLAGIELLYVLLSGFGALAKLGGALFFLAMLGTELLFSTKVGDLAKMTKELKGPTRHPPP